MHDAIAQTNQSSSGQQTGITAGASSYCSTGAHRRHAKYQAMSRSKPVDNKSGKRLPNTRDDKENRCNNPQHGP